jgi:Cu(I)/Ag(I) efflux system membrane fusion protein
MNNNTNCLKANIQGYKWLFLLVLLISFASACTQPQKKVSTAKSTSYYTCSMHPQIHEDHPGNCPICGMKLIKVEAALGKSNAVKNSILLSQNQIKLAGIELDTINYQSVASEKIVTGTVTGNENEADAVSAMVAGRVQRLYVRTTGEKIEIGSPIFDIYSEDLLEAEKEYLLSLQQRKELNNADIDYKQLVQSAENKLLLWGLSPWQIKRLAISGKVSSTVSVLSKVSGTVTEINVHEGDYVTEGMSMMKTQNLNSLWVEAQLYASETSSYTENSKVKVSFPELNGKMINGKITFVNPELSNSSKVSLARIEIPNEQGLIRPGMLAYISVSSGQQKTLAIRTTALLIDGKGTTVWIRNTDGSFSSKRVILGQGNSIYSKVLSGLSAGELVVTNGAYLLNSEFIFKNGEDMKDMDPNMNMGANSKMDPNMKM